MFGQGFTLKLRPRDIILGFFWNVKVKNHFYMTDRRIYDFIMFFV